MHADEEGGMSIAKHINTLCEMADYFAAHGDDALAAECRETANMILDAVAYASIFQEAV